MGVIRGGGVARGSKGPGGRNFAQGPNSRPGFMIGAGRGSRGRGGSHRNGGLGGSQRLATQDKKPAEVSDPKPKPYCQLLKFKLECKKGDECPFSHDLPLQAKEEREGAIGGYHFGADASEEESVEGQRGVDISEISTEVRQEEDDSSTLGSNTTECVDSENAEVNEVTEKLEGI